MREERAFHTLADLFPLIPENELKDLAADIKENGLRIPITLYENKILDGRNRYLACKSVGVGPKFADYKGTDPLKEVISLNLKRRHLNQSQRAMVAAKALPLIPELNPRLSRGELQKLCCSI